MSRTLYSLLTLHLRISNFAPLSHSTFASRSLRLCLALCTRVLHRGFVFHLRLALRAGVSHCAIESRSASHSRFVLHHYHLPQIALAHYISCLSIALCEVRDANAICENELWFCALYHENPVKRNCLSCMLLTYCVYLCRKCQLQVLAGLWV